MFHNLLESIKHITSIEVTFYILSVLTLFGALGTIFSRNPVHSVIYLILTFFTLSAHYVLLNAQFLAVVNIIVYAGAIMVLFLFVIMFLNLRNESDEMKQNLTIYAAEIMGGMLFLILFAALKKADIERVRNPMTFDSQTGMVETLGRVLYSEYLLPFELTSVLFLVAMAGAVMLGKREAGERHF
jgi:NADH-quinone oxidoreductase subunit J